MGASERSKASSQVWLKTSPRELTIAFLSVLAYFIFFQSIYNFLTGHLFYLFAYCLSPDSSM